jgi:threonine/homoserine/homoserine lactone efflux protein
MAPEGFWALAVFALVSTISPGGATTLATASGARFGFRRSLPLMLGIAAGLASMAVAAVAGLAGLLLAKPSLQLAMKASGSVYLIWLAWNLGRSGPPRRQAGLDRPTGFLTGAWMLWHNPKGWAMTMSAAASFTALAEGPGGLAVLLGLTLGAAAVVSLSAWCMAGQILARLLQTDRQWRRLNAVLGILLAASVLPMWL